MATVRDARLVGGATLHGCKVGRTVSIASASLGFLVVAAMLDLKSAEPFKVSESPKDASFGKPRLAHEGFPRWPRKKLPSFFKVGLIEMQIELRAESSVAVA